MSFPDPKVHEFRPCFSGTVWNAASLQRYSVFFVSISRIWVREISSPKRHRVDIAVADKSDRAEEIFKSGKG